MKERDLIIGLGIKFSTRNSIFVYFMTTSFQSNRDEKHMLIHYAWKKHFHEAFRINFSRYGKIYICFLLCILERTMNNNKLKSISQPCINHYAPLHIVLIRSAIHHHGQNQNELIGLLDNQIFSKFEMNQ